MSFWSMDVRPSMCKSLQKAIRFLSNWHWRCTLPVLIFLYRNESLFETYTTCVVSPGWSTSLGVPSESSKNKRNGSGNLNMNTSLELLICNDVSFHFLIMSLCFLFRLICEVKTKQVVLLAHPISRANSDSERNHGKKSDQIQVTTFTVYVPPGSSKVLFLQTMLVEQ